MRSLVELWLRFMAVGAFSFGGGYAVLPAIREQMVGPDGWLAPREFADLVALSQMTPGPLAVNASTFVGFRVAGLAGALVATAGCVAAGLFLSGLLYAAWRRRGGSRLVRAVLDALGAASGGLIAAAAAGLALWVVGRGAAGVENARGGDVDPAAFILMGGGLLLSRRFRLHPVAVTAAAGVAGYFIYA